MSHQMLKALIAAGAFGLSLFGAACESGPDQTRPLPQSQMTIPADPLLTTEQVKEAMLMRIDLSDGQRAEFDTIMGEYRDEVDSWRRDNESEFQRLRADIERARAGGSRRDMRRAGRELRALAEQRPDPEPYFDRVREIMTEQQAAQFDRNLENMRDEARQRARERMRD